MRLEIRRALVGLLSLLLGLASLAVLAPNAQADTTPTAPDHLVISEVNGDQSGVYRTNWVELYNPTDSAINLGTMDTSTTPATVHPNYYMCYASQAGTTCSSPYKLYGTVLAHHHFLIEIYDAGNTLPAMPSGVTPDLNFGSTDATVNPSQQAAKNIGGYSTGGQILLLDASVDNAGAYPTAANYPASAYSTTNRNLADPSINPSPVVDAMGFTPVASASTLAGTEGWVSTTNVHSAPVQDASHWDERKFVSGVPQDTNDNAADFQISQRDPISQLSSRVAVAALNDTEISRGEAMAPIQVQASKGVGTLTYEVDGLPDGVSFDPTTDLISGTPLETDALKDYPVDITVTDQTPGTPDTASTSFTLTLSNALRVDSQAKVSAHKDAEITPIQISAHGGTPDYHYAATGLPSGVDIDPSTGVITGTPVDAVGKYSVHVTVTDSSADAVSVDFTFVELSKTTGPATSDPLAGLRINEVKATGTAANDWVELANTGADVTGATVDLTDNAGDVYHVPAQDFTADGYVTVDGADLDAAGLDLAASGALYLTETDGTLLDQTSWTSYPSTSWARYPDRTGDFTTSKQATRNAANSVPAAYATDHLVVAAVYGADGTTFNSDWVELYNPTEAPIVLGTLNADNTVTPNYYQCYRSNSSNTCSSMKLYGTVQPHHYFLIWNGHNADTSVDAHSKGQPPAGITPDLDFRYGTNDTNSTATKTANDPSGQVNNGFGGCNTGGQLWLLNSASGGVAPGGDMSSASARTAGVVDGVGWTSSGVTQPTGAESQGSSTVAGFNSGTNNACVIARKSTDGYLIDTDANSTDFKAIQDPGTFDLQSQASERVAITPVNDAEISLNEAMSPIHVQAQAIFGALTFAASGLPGGIAIDPSTGVISGTPDAADELKDYPVTVTVGDAVASDTASISFTLTLSKLLRLEPITNVSVHKGAALTPIQVTAHGGTPAYTYSARGLPAGVTIDASTGVISGTPADELGHYTAHVTVTDSGVGDAQASVSQDFTVVELPPLGGPAADDPLAGLTINEVKATGTPADDWIELYNTGGALTGASVRLENSTGDTYALPAQDIAAGGYVVIHGGDLDAAGFHLAASDVLYLTEPDDTLLDQTSWTSFAPTSWARTTDGTGSFGVSGWATMAAANSGAPVINPNDLLVTEVNYDANSTDWYEYSEVTNTTDHPIDFSAYGLTMTKSGAVMTFHDPSDTSKNSPIVDPVIPAHGTQLFWWVENQYGATLDVGTKTTADFLANYGLAPSTNVVLVYGFSSMANSGGDHSYYISVNHGAAPISQAWVDTPCAANTFNGSAVCTATNGNYAEHYAVPADRTDPIAAVWYNSLAAGGDDINHSLKPALSSPTTVDLEQLGFTRAVKVTLAGDQITLHNTSTGAVDLSGYVLQKNNTGTAYTLPTGTTVTGGADLAVGPGDSGLTFGDRDYVTLFAPRGYAYSDGYGIIDTTGPFLHTLPYDASSGEDPVIDETTGLPLPPAGGLYRPAGVSALNGTVYVSNTGDNVLAELDSTGNAIIAGSLERYGFDTATQDGGAAADANLYQPGGSAADADGNVYVADSGDNLVLKITPDGKIHRFAGTGNAGGTAATVTATSTPTTVNLWHPQTVTVDSAGDVFIADTFDNRVLEVTAAGAITVVAGTGKAGYSGDGAAATSARLSQPAGVALDANRDVYIADSSNNVIRRVDAVTGVITTVAGNYAADQANNDCLGAFSGDGGPATSAQLNDPQGVALDGAGDLFIADTFNNAIREVTPDGTITTLVNTSTAAGAEGTGRTGSGAFPGVTHLNTPYAVAVDAVTNALYIADTKNSAIAEVINAARSGSASGPAESADALAISSSTTASNACAALVNGPLVSTSAPTISGTPAVGSTLTADPGGWTPSPDSFTYQWLRDGSAIDGATNQTYAVTAADGGHALSVSVTAVKAEFASASATSATVSVPVPSLAAGTPTITGTATVGSTLTVNAGTWTPTPDSLSYRWLRDGAAITGATAATYVVTSADAGHKLSVTVTGAKAGYTSASATSAPVSVPAPVVPPKTLTTATPTITGSFKVGATLTARPGTWKAGSATVTAFSYQWLRNGQKIPGATKSTYHLVGPDKGTRISVTVTGSYAGYVTAARTSSAHLIAAGNLSTHRPTIVGSARVGHTLTARAGVWKAGSTTLTGSHLTYQWYVNGKKIKGARKSTLKITSSYRGKKIAVTVTGGYAGYTSASSTSKSTSAVKK